MLHILGGRPNDLWAQVAHTVQAQRSAKRRCLVLVPEQLTLKTERDLLDALNVPGFFDVEVLSPSRLSQRVFALAGTDTRVRIDNNGKQMALAGALLGVRKQLVYYESAAEKQGFIARAGAWITDMKRAGVTPEALAAHAQTLPQGASRDKLMDLALIYAAYDSQLAGRFVDGEDVLGDMLLRIPQSGLAKDACVLSYGFDVLTEQYGRILCALGAQAYEVYALLALERELDAFTPVLDGANRLLRMAGLQRLEARLAFLPPTARAAAPDLLHLEREFLRPKPSVFAAVPGALRLYAAPTPYAEAHQVAQEILLLHEHGVAFGEMSVLFGSLPRYAGVTAAVFKAYNIPCYIARKLPAAAHGAARFLLAALHAVSGGYLQPDMLDVIKSGYAKLTDAEVFALENYMLAHGTKGKYWLNPFLKDEQAEAARIALVTPLEALRSALRAAQDADGALRAIFALLTDVEAHATCLTQEQQLLERHMPEQAAKVRQVWQVLMDLLSQAHELMAGKKIPAKHLAAWLEAGLEATELAALPPDADSVACGELGNLSPGAPHALFVMGLNDGILQTADSALMSEQEREQTEAALEVYLSLGADGRDRLALLDLWKALSAPTEALFLSHAQASQDGAALRPLSQLSLVRRLFPLLVEEGGVSATQGAAFPLAPQPTLDALALRLQTGDVEGDWLEAWRWLCTHQPQRAHALVAAPRRVDSAAPLPRQVTHQLFMERIFSVSRLETFAVCPYKHFVTYGLKPQPRKELKLQPKDTGTFYHSALEGFTRLLPSLPEWPKVDKKSCDALMDKAADGLMDKLLPGTLADSARARATAEKYRQLLRRVAWTFTKTAQQSAFRPTDAEVRFGEEGGLPPLMLTLQDGSRVMLRGTIDRIDRYTGDEGMYLRVVDYKSGHDAVSATRIWWGTQLQLLIYLAAALETDGMAEPAGAFYFHLDDPVIADPGLKRDVEEALAAELKLKGIVLKDAQVVRLMDSGEPPLSLAKLLKKDGDFEKNKTVATLEQMRDLIAHAQTMAAQLAWQVRSGEIAAAPLCEGDNTPCTYCDYRAICRQDGNRTARMADSITFDQLLENVNRQKEE